MSMGGGMDMGTNFMFTDTNSALARGYWYIVVGVLAFTFSLRVLNYFQTSMRYSPRKDMINFISTNKIKVTLLKITSILIPNTA